MKKNTANKKVLRAMSIALATMMAVSSMPMDVLASDAPADGAAPADDANKTYDEAGAKSTTADAAREAVDQAEASAQTVADYIDNNIKTDIPVFDETTGAVLNEAHLIPEALKTVESTLAVADADITVVENYLASDNISKVTGSGYDEAYKANVQAYVAAVAAYGENGPKEPVAPADDADEATVQAYEESKKAYEDFMALKDEITKQLNKGENDYNVKKVLAPAIADVTSDAFVSEAKANEKVEAAYEEGTSIAEAASKEQGKADAAGEEALKLAEETEKQFAEYVDNIKNAATIADANESFDKLVETLESAETTLAEKQAAYDAAKEAYEAYQKMYKDQQDVISKAEADYDTAKAIYEEAAKKYGDKNAAYEKKVEDLKKYHDALEDAEAKYISANKDLLAIQSKAEALANAAEVVKNQMLEENSAALDVIAKIDVVNSDKEKIEWGHENDLFASIVKNYYVPKVLKGTFVSLGSWQSPVNNAHLSADDIASGVTAGEFNYIILKYKDATGKIITKYLDYKREKGITADEGTDRIVIFEKRDSEVAAATKQKNNKDTLLYNEGVNVDYYKVGNDKLTQSELDAKLRDGSIVAIDGVYYQQGKGAVTAQVTYDDTTGLVSDTTSTVDEIEERTVITIDTKSVKGTFKKDDDGNVVQEFTANETTVVYHKSLSSDERGTATNADGEEVTTYQYDNKADAKNALALAESSLTKDDKKISASVVEEKHTVSYEDTEEVDVNQYQASGEYVSAFATNITLNAETTCGEWYVSKWIAGRSEEEAIQENIQKIENKLAEKYAKDTVVDGMYILDTKIGDISVSGADKYIPGIGFETVKSSAVCSVTYAQVQTTDNLLNKKNEWKDILAEYGYKESNKEQSDNDSFATALNKYLESDEGKAAYLYRNVEVKKNIWGKIQSIKFEYVATQTITGDVVTAAAAKGADADTANEAAIAQAKANLATKAGNLHRVSGGGATVVGTDTAELTVTKTKDVTTYGYELSYWKQIDSDKTNVVTETDTYGNAITVKGAVQQNKNFYNNSSANFVPSSDKDFQAFIENAGKVKEKYEKLVADAVQAKKDVLTAQAQVKALGEAVGVLKESKDKNGDKVKDVHSLEPLVLLDGVEFNPKNYSLEELEAFLATAAAELQEAKDRLDNLKAQMADIEKVRDARIAALTPAPASPAEETVLPEEDGAPAGLFATAGTTAYVSAGDVAPAAAPMFAFPTAGITTPAAGVAGARTGRTGNGTVDELEGTDGEILGNKKLDGDSVVAEDENPLAINEKTIKTIKDNETPLAAFPDEETNKMNWWWLLIIALLGATGEEMYRRNQKKKAEEAALNAEINQDNK